MVNAVNAFRRRSGEPTHSPMAGASSATVTPAMAIARPSQLAGEVPPGPPTATFVVRYTLKTKMTTIAFSPAEPQSHSAHTSTRDLLTVAHFIVPGMPAIALISLQAFVKQFVHQPNGRERPAQFGGSASNSRSSESMMSRSRIYPSPMGVPGHRWGSG